MHRWRRKKAGHAPPLNADRRTQGVEGEPRGRPEHGQDMQRRGEEILLIASGSCLVIDAIPSLGTR